MKVYELTCIVVCERTVIRSYILFMNEKLDKLVSFSYNKTQGDTTPERVSADNKDAVIGAIIQSLSFAKSKVTSVLLFLNRLSNNARSIGSRDVAKSCGFKSQCGNRTRTPHSIERLTQGSFLFILYVALWSIRFEFYSCYFVSMCLTLYITKHLKYKGY